VFPPRHGNQPASIKSRSALRTRLSVRQIFHLLPTVYPRLDESLGCQDRLAVDEDRVSRSRERHIYSSMVLAGNLDLNRDGTDADATHAGVIAWSSPPATLGQAREQLEQHPNGPRRFQRQETTPEKYLTY
jgi:hypothetical protein